MGGDVAEVVREEEAMGRQERDMKIKNGGEGGM